MVEVLLLRVMHIASFVSAASILFIMTLTDMKNYRRVIPSTGGVGLREDANRSSFSADVDGDFQDAMDKEDSRCICIKSKATSAGSQDLDTAAIIRTLQRTSSNSKFSLHISSQQQHRQEEDTHVLPTPSRPPSLSPHPLQRKLLQTKPNTSIAILLLLRAHLR